MKGRKRLGRKKGRKGISKKSLYEILFVAVIVSIVLIFFALYLYFPLRLSSNQPSQTFQFKAAIVDHLSLSQPNPAFNQTATNVLKEAGWTVDYYLGEEVTVNFYKNLPTHNYGLIILRVHSALGEGDEPPVALFTSQIYSSSEYTWEQLTDQLKPVGFDSHDEQKYFGIFPEFVKSSMKGKFVNTTVILMGCNGLTYTEMAQAFIDKGAKAYISWSEAVLVNHTDQETIQLLEKLITENQTIKEAVDEIDPDPAYDSKLGYYPKTAEEYVIPKPKSNLTTNVAETNPKIEKLKDCEKV